MTDKILVTYASRTGSTAGVAEAIGKTLTDNGCSCGGASNERNKRYDSIRSWTSELKPLLEK